MVFGLKYSRSTESGPAALSRSTIRRAVAVKFHFPATSAKAILKNLEILLHGKKKLIFELNQSLDGYVDHQKMGPPRPALFRHFIAQVRGLTGMVYGRRMYEVMSYWDKDQSDWDAQETEYAAAWRSKRKWVVSRTL